MPGSAPDQIVLDTNIIVSAAIKNNFREIVALRSLHKIRIYTCEHQLRELLITLRQQRIVKKLPAEPEVFVEIFEGISIVTDIDERFDRSPDPDDNYLFDLAYTVKSFYLVTQEKALLNMKQVNKIKIISFRELRRLVGA